MNYYPFHKTETSSTEYISQLDQASACSRAFFFSVSVSVPLSQTHHECVQRRKKLES